MTPGRPLILMALANDAQNSLRLGAEEKEVRNELAAAHDDDRIEFRSLGNTSLEDIYKDINRSRQKLAIFHFSGHSNGDGLKLQDTMAKKKSLGTLLGKLPYLQLVFLNGCANREQVEVLHRSGVRTVIATTALIEDQNAVVFAKMFYQSMAGGHTIKAAFDMAVSFLQNDHSSMTFASVQVKVITRGLVMQLDKEEAFPWGLYYQDVSDVAWHMPFPEQLDETLAKDVKTIGGADFQLDETIAKETSTIGSAYARVDAVEIETNDKRVQNLNGILRIESGSILLGRHPSCQVVILDNGVSRRHGRIYRQGDQMMLSDENSTNFTFWKSKKDALSSKKRISQMPLSEDGTLWLDEVEFTVRVIK